MCGNTPVCPAEGQSCQARSLFYYAASHSKTLPLKGGRVPWLGRLPGDIFIQRGNFSFYFPLTACLLISALLSLLFFLLRR